MFKLAGSQSMELTNVSSKPDISEKFGQIGYWMLKRLDYLYILYRTKLVLKSCSGG